MLEMFTLLSLYRSLLLTIYHKNCPVAELKQLAFSTTMRLIRDAFSLTCEASRYSSTQSGQEYDECLRIRKTLQQP